MSVLEFYRKVISLNNVWNRNQYSRLEVLLSVSFVPRLITYFIKLKCEQKKSLDEIDGLMVKLVDGDILHLRPLGNNRELRCYAESTQQNAAKDLVKVILTAVKGLLN